MTLGTIGTPYDSSGANSGRTFWELIDEIADFAAVDKKGAALAKVRRCIEDGYQMFLNPPALPGENKIHEWSFLTPYTTLSLVSGDWEYDLPGDFGGMAGDFTYAENLGLGRIQNVSESTLRHMREVSDSNGDPKYFALITKAFASVSGQYTIALFHPTPNTARTLTYPHTVQTNRMATPLSSGTGVLGTTTIALDSVTDATATFSTDGAAVDGYVILSATTGEENDGIYRIASVPSETAVEFTTTIDSNSDTGCTYEVFNELIYAYGGRAYSNTVLQCCRAIADQRFNDSISTEMQMAHKMLADSVRTDRRNAPDFIYPGRGSVLGGRAILPVKYST